MSLSKAKFLLEKKIVYSPELNKQKKPGKLSSDYNEKVETPADLLSF